MDLQKLVFSVDSTQLDEARIKIAKLGDAVAALNKPLQDMSRSSAKTNEVIAKSELAAEKARVATKALADTTGQVKEKVDPLAKLIEKLSNNYTDMASGFTKGESSILNQARNLGVFGSELQPVIALLEKIKTLNKDPFDASLGGVRSITQEFEKLQQRANLAAQGIMLTSKQLGEYSKLAAEAAGKVEGMGFDPKSGEGLNKYNRLLAESQNKYLEIVASVNKLTQAEKDRNDALKQQERLLASNKAISDAMIREVAGQVGQKSPELQQMAEFYKKQELAARQLAAAEDNLILREQKLAFVNKELAAGLSTASANALFKYQKDLEALGKSADEVSRRMTAFRAGLVERQSHSPFTKLTQEAETTNKRLDHLSRALGPQITDIFVGLATGQSLLTVALQQGGQIRDQIALAGVASSDMGKALSTAAVQMVASLKDVAVAMGSLLITPFIAGGKAVTDFATKIVFANKTIQAYSLALALYADNGNKLASGVINVMSKIPMLIGASFAAATLAVTSLTVAFFVAQKELDNLSKQLILTGGSLGLNRDSALDYAKALDGVSGSTSQVIAVIQAMAKQGGFLREEISLVTKSAIELEKYAGVSIEDTVKAFAKLKEEPVKALLELAKQTGMVSAETLNMVVTLEKQGSTSQAAAIAVKALADVNSEQVDRMKRDYSSLGLTLIEVGDWFANLWRQAKGLVYEPTAMEQAVKALQQADVALTEAQKSLNSSENLSIKPSTQAIDILRQRLDARKNEYVQLIKNQQAENQSRINNAAIADAKKRSLDLEASAMSPIEKAKANIAKYTGEIAKAELLVASTKDEQVIKDTLIGNLKKSIAKENENIAKENKKNNAEGLSEAKKQENYYKTLLDNANNYYAKMVGGTEELTQAEVNLLQVKNDPRWALLSKQEQKNLEVLWMKNAAIEEQNKLLAAQRKIDIASGENRNKIISDGIKEVESINQRVKEQGILNELLAYEMSLSGSNSEQVQYLVELKKEELEYEKKIADIKAKGLLPAQETDALAALEKEFELRKRNLDVRTYKKEFEALQKELGDVMFLALTNRGAQAGKKLRDLIKAELMKPITVVVNAVVNTLLGQVSGALGLSSGGASDALSLASNLSGLAGIGSAFGTAFGASAMSTLGLGGSSAAMTTSLANAGYWSGSAAATSASSLGASIGAYAPYALAAVVALDQLGILDRWSGDPDAFLVQQATGVNQSYSTSTQSRLGTVGFVNGSASIMKNGKLVSEYGETEGISTQAQNAALAVILSLDNAIAETLNESQIKKIAENMSGWYQKSWSVESGTIEDFIASRYETILGSLDSSFGKLKDYQKEGEKLADTAVRLINTFTTVRSVFDSIGINVDELTYKTANDFATVFGGVDKLGSSLSKFYDKFYTEEEKTVNLAKNTTEAFDALGLALPSSRDAFKELVKSAINAGNPQLLASLLGLQDAFTTLTEPVEELKNKFKELSDSLLEEVNRLRGAVISDIGLSGGIPGLTAEFAILTAQAKSGNISALEKLPEYSQAIEQAVAASAVNASDVAYARAWLAESLGNTSAVLNGTSPSIVSTGLTQDVAGTTTVNGATALTASASSQSDLIAILVAEIQGLRAEVRADVSANTKTSKILERANQDGETLSVTVAA